MEEKKKTKNKRELQANKPTDKELIKKNNDSIKELNRQLEVVFQKFIDNPQPFFEQREKEIAKVIEKYGDLKKASFEGEDILMKKDYAIQLSRHLTKPLIPSCGSVLAKHTPHSIKMVADWYWDNIVIKANETMQFIPSIYHLCKLLNISKDTFSQYLNNGNEQMRETCCMVRDEFVDYYQQKGLTKELNDVMAMFVLKTSFGQRENEAPQIAVVNVNTSADEKIAKYARQNGFEIWNENNN